MTSAHTRILAESPHYVLEHEYETVFLVHRPSLTRTVVASHYGDPTAALITPDEAWFITGGEGIVCQHVTGDTIQFFRQGFEPVPTLAGVSGSPFSIHALRLEGAETVRVLVDPWSSNASVWRINLLSRTVEKLRDGPFMANELYREDVAY